jgi:2',3'-cyclic-nucleotide 2'-phosphodiesterase (5'-nucleotidase family)
MDVQVLGNHEFDYGQDILQRYMTRAHYPVICANVNANEKAEISQPKPYVILTTRDKIKIAVVGAIQIGENSMQPSALPDNLEGLTFSGGIGAISRHNSLRQKSDVFMALTHLGLGEDKKLAQQMAGLDLIIGGHSHDLEMETTKNGVLIVQARKYSKFLGRVDLVVKNGDVVKKWSSLIDLSTIKQELQDVRDMIETFKDNQEMNEVVIELSNPLEGKEELGNLITDAIRDSLKVQIAFQNSGGIRIDKLPGMRDEQVIVCDIYNMLPFENWVCKVEMTSDEIKQLIKDSFVDEGRGGIGLQVSGIKYDVTYRKTAEGEVEIIEVVLKDLPRKSENNSNPYTVAVNNYIYSKYIHQNLKDRYSCNSQNKKLAGILLEFLGKGIDAQKYKGVKRAHAIEEK